MRYAALLLAITLIPTVLSAAPAAPRVDASLTTSFSVDTNTAIPGATIAAGQYDISVVEHLSDRVILRVTDTKGKVQSMFLGLTTTALPAAGASGPIPWTGKGANALRGFSFPGAPPVEFVYPKTQAVAIAKENSDKVLAIDPASDNLSVSHDNLSKQDMQIVTLWTLRSTRVGPDAQPAIEAARYQAPAPQPPAAQPANVAYATPPPPLQSRSASEPPMPNTSQNTISTRKHAVTSLPHTASSFPVMLVAALLALLAAAGLRLRRLQENAI